VTQRSDYAGTVHEASSEDGDTVTPSDTATLRRHSRGIYVGGTGDLTVQFLSGKTATFVAVPAGALLGEPLGAMLLLRRKRQRFSSAVLE
jgi:hypothetical protein